MGIDPAQIPERLTKLMSDQDRLAFRLPPAPQLKHQKTNERKEQGLVWNWLLRHEIKSIWHRLDRRTGATCGTPDFIIALPNGKTLWLEMKSWNGQRTKEQAEFCDYLSINGHHYCLAHCADEAIKAIILLL